MMLERIGVTTSTVIGFALFLGTVEASSKFDRPDRFKGNGVSVFNAFSSLVEKHKPVDIGEGRPNYKPPEILSEALVEAARGDQSLSQYSRDLGLPRLVKAIAKFYSQLMNRALDPMDNVIVTVGATQALYEAFQTHTSPGDEWIIIEPSYLAYEPMIRAAYGVPKFVTMKPRKQGGVTWTRDWTFDRAELARAFCNRTKGIVLNTPHNPTGKVFALDELKFIAQLAKKWNTLVISDEVYQFLTYDQNEHIRIATLPGMFERTITIGSAGKAFSATGYRIGWAIGGKKILDNFAAIQEHVTLNPPTLIQEAFAVQFESEIKNYGTQDSYLYQFRKVAESKRNFLVDRLTDFGIDVIVPEGGYFVMGNLTRFAEKIDLRNETGSSMDVRFVKWMIKNVGVFALPMSGFQSKSNGEVTEDILRFTFVKTDEVLEEANKRFHSWKSKNEN